MNIEQLSVKKLIRRAAASAAVLFLLSAFPFAKTAYADPIASGDIGTEDATKVSWKIEKVTTGQTTETVLTIYPKDGRTSGKIAYSVPSYPSGGKYWPWQDSSYRSKITKVVVEPGVGFAEGQSADHMFYNLSNVKSITLTQTDSSGNKTATLDTSNVTDMTSMFYGCSGLTSLDVSNFNTGNVTDMGSMFSGCSGLTSLDISNFNTGKIASSYYMSSIFTDADKITKIKLGQNYNVKYSTGLYHIP